MLQSEGILFHEDRACLAAVIQDRNNLQKHVQQAERRSLLDVRKAKRRQPSRGSKQGVPLPLHGFDLLENEFEAIKLPANLTLQVAGQRPAISCLAPVLSCPSFSFAIMVDFLFRPLASGLEPLFQALDYYGV